MDSSCRIVNKTASTIFLLICVSATLFSAQSVESDQCEPGQGAVAVDRRNKACVLCPQGSYGQDNFCLECPAFEMSYNEGSHQCTSWEFECAEEENLYWSTMVHHVNLPREKKKLKIPRIGGSCRFQTAPLSGRAHTSKSRLGAPRYRNIKGAMVTGPHPRQVSNSLCHQGESEHSNQKGTNLLMIYFGQFVDHDLTLVKEGIERDPIEVFESPLEILKGVKEMSFNRSSFVRNRPMSSRMYLNTLSSWLDLGQVYGDSTNLSSSLRTGESGKLKMSSLNSGKENFLPFENPITGEVLTNCDTACKDLRFKFKCGDSRCNENLVLTAAHVIFAREHNRLADKYIKNNFIFNPELRDEEIFQNARLRNIAQYQRVVVEFLEALVGRKNLKEFGGTYSGLQSVDPSIELHFSTAAFRFGHSAISDNQLRIKVLPNGSRVEEKVPLFDSFEASYKYLETPNLVSEILNGESFYEHEEIDPKIVTTLRNYLNRENLDLAAINIKRGRDHGLLPLNKWRKRLRESRSSAKNVLEQYSSFKDIGASELETIKLREVYGDQIESLDPWVGGLFEPHFQDSSLGETFTISVIDQFMRIRDSDPTWFEQEWVSGLDPEISKVTLASIINQNLEGHGEPGLIKEGPSFHLKQLYTVRKTPNSVKLEWTGYDDEFRLVNCNTDVVLRVSQKSTATHKTLESFEEKAEGDDGTFSIFTVEALEPNTEYETILSCEDTKTNFLVFKTPKA